MERLSISSSEPITPQRALERLFADQEQLDLEAWFACSSIDFMIFKGQGLEELDQLLECLRDHFGAYQRVVHAEEESPEDDGSNGQSFLVQFEQGAVPTSIRLDSSDGRIVELSFACPGAGSFPIDLDEAVAKLRQWQGELSLLVLDNGLTAADLNAERPMAVGSAFKLAILSALKQQIDAGDRSWSDVVQLKPEWKSLPSGILQDWVDGSPLTLNTLATLMISISDNTAADSLINVLGREAVEKFAERNRPFLTTREFFIIKCPDNATLLDQYRKLSGHEIERRAFLRETLDKTPLPVGLSDWTAPLALDVEFFFSARELCALMDRVCDLRLMAVNTGGIIDPSDWARLAFKGGSEPGVLNLTIWLEAHNGRKFNLVLTANDPDAALNETKLILLLLRLLENLKAR